MIELKLATWDHLPDIMEMAEKFHSASPYRDTEEFDDSRVAEIVIPAIESPIDRIVLILEDTEARRAVGMLIALATQSTFSRSKVAGELAWWVNPENRGKDSLKLIDAYLYWAENVAKCDTIQMALLEDETVEKVTRVYRRKGFVPAERAFIRKVH